MAATVHPPSTSRPDGGFSLVEVLVVIAVLGVLSTVVVFAMRGSAEQAGTAACAADRAIVERAVEVWTAQEGELPAPTMDDLVDGGLLRSASVFHQIDADGRITAFDTCDGEPGDGATSPTPATTWTPTQGSSNITEHEDGSLSISGNTHVFNDRPLGVDGTVALTAQMEHDADAGRHGSWGIWVRAELVDGRLRSGYTFQWDLAFGRDGTFVLRHWDTVPNSAETGMYFRECTRPTATAPLDAEALGPGPHRVAVSLAGPRLTATVDGVVVMQVADLNAAVAASAGSCPHHRPPQGEHTGIRAWGSPLPVGTFTDLTYS